MEAAARFRTCTLTRGGTVTDTVWTALDDVGICAAAGVTPDSATISTRMRM
jgi:hypothetical protein